MIMNSDCQRRWEMTIARKDSDGSKTIRMIVKIEDDKGLYNEDNGTKNTEKTCPGRSSSVAKNCSVFLHFSFLYISFSTFLHHKFFSKIYLNIYC